MNSGIRAALLLAGLLLSTFFLSPAAQAPRDDACPAVFVPREEVQPLVKALEEAAPAELRQKGPEAFSEAWTAWVAKHRAATQKRMRRGDEDLLGNFILFGTSFTAQPRITQRDLARVNQAAADAGTLAARVMAGRLDDFVRALETPGANDRLVYLRRLIEREGYSFANAAARAKLRQYIVSNLLRVLEEQKGFAKEVEAARRLGDSTSDFATRSTVYRARGLSVDTKLFPSFAVEEALKAMKARGLLTAVGRAAVIGPGLDFADKQQGYDFYPEQTIQPFALVDSLLRLGLSQTGKLDVATMDISLQVNSHLESARRRARRDISYILQLPRDLDSSWKPDIISYWEHFGSQIGSAAKAAAVPSGIKRLSVRAVGVHPDIVLRISPCDLNIVLQRLDLPEAKKFDLIVATNMLIYYDVFEQSLAMANIAHMLKPSGFLLSNNALLEFPGSPLHSVDYLTVVYSGDRPDDGDHIVWYQRR